MSRDLENNILISEFKIKHFDTDLIAFKYIDEGIKGQKVEITYQNQEARELFPTGLEISGDGIMSWMKRRIIPKNREYVDALLSKMGLSHSDTIGIARICKGLSLVDCYWIVENDFEGKFDDYNLYDNKFEKNFL